MREIESVTVEMYSTIVEGRYANLEKAKKLAEQNNWSEVEKLPSSRAKYLIYECTVNGVDIWYQINGNKYYFSEAVPEP